MFLNSLFLQAASLEPAQGDAILSVKDRMDVCLRPVFSKENNHLLFLKVRKS